MRGKACDASPPTLSLHVPALRAALLAILVLLASTSPVHADTPVAIVPSDSGYIGAWLVSGRIPRLASSMFDPANVELSSGTPIVPGAWWPVSRVIATHDGALNLIQLLSAGTVAGGHALLNGKLSLSEPLDGLLMLGVQGNATVYVDGVKLHEHERPPARQRSWDAIPLKLDAGVHNVVLWLTHPGVYWSVETRLLERETLLPPRGGRLLLPGTKDRHRNALARQMLAASCSPGLVPWGYVPRLRLEYPRGAPAQMDARVFSSAKADQGRSLYGTLSLGSIPVGPRGIAPFEATLPRVESRELSQWVPERFNVDVSVGNVRRRLVLTLGRDVSELYARASEKLANVAAGRYPRFETSSVVAATLEAKMSRIAALGTSPKGDRANLIREAKSLRRLLDRLDEGVDPLLDAKGVVEVARYSVATGQPEWVRVHVPESYDPDARRRYPLVVALHGYGGSPRGIMRAFLDTLSTRPHEDVDGFVLAPAAHDDSFYRGPGEADVLGAIAWLGRIFPIDPDRVSVTGVSMGGTGAARLALRYPERFSAAAPLAGYHSYFTKWDVHGKRLRPWEHDRVLHFSPYAWAENGLHLPMFVAHGTTDEPLENSRVLVRRYQQLGLSMTDEWPAWGHSVWEVVYRRRRMWSWLSQHVRPTAPPDLVVKAEALRYGAREFASIDAFETWGSAGTLAARVTSPGHVSVTDTTNVERFSLRREGALYGAHRVEVTLGSQTFTFPADRPVSLSRTPARTWQPTPAARQTGKRPGVEGPVMDAYLGPLVVSYGTQDPSMTRVNREVAGQLSHYLLSNATYRVVEDTKLDEALLGRHSVIVVGNERSHTWLRRLGSRLPIRAVGGELHVGKQRHQGTGLGATFIHPNPEHPHNYVVAVVGTDAGGVLRALSLPRLLPDFLVYDGGINGAAGEQVLNDAWVIAGGFFDSEWRLPADATDPLAP